MAHGSQEFFFERARFERRVSLITAAVSLVFLVFQLPFVIPPMRRLIRERVAPLMPVELRHFGFEEGPEQYVRRIVLQVSGPPGPKPGTPTIVYRSAQALKGGRPSDQPASDHPHALPDTRPVGQGGGDSPEDLMAMARVVYGGSGPVLRSDELILQQRVQPEYPKDAFDRDIEGRVELVAFVDTTGAVTRVDVISNGGERQFEDAVLAAVMRWRYRPYVKDGRVQEVHVPLRFVFIIERRF